MKSKKLYFLYFNFINVYLGLSQAQFRDISGPAGIQHSGNYIGVAVTDFDQDGRDDVFVSNRQGPDRLYRNMGNNSFAEVTQLLGLQTPQNTECALWLDVNHDGWQDLFLGQYESNCRLFLNINGQKLIDITAISGIENIGNVRACLANDVDLDGDLDIYVANLGKENALLINNGALHFENRILQSGATDSRLSMGATFFDYDRDGDADLYLIHDANQDFILYENDGTGNFKDISVKTKANFKSQGMGVSAGDFNNDGRMDLYITNLFDNALLICQPDGTYTDIAKSAGVNDNGMGWGNTYLDYNNDGWLDIYVCNDYYFSPYRNLLFENLGNMKFNNVASGTALASQNGSYGTAWLDIDGNGYQDIFIANYGKDGNKLFLNNATHPGNWIEFDFNLQRHNRFGIGTRIVVEANGQTWMQELAAGSGYASQNPQRLHFGLGPNTTIDRVVFYFPGGDLLEWSTLPANKRYTVTDDQVFTQTISIGNEEQVNVFLNSDHSLMYFTGTEHPLVFVRMTDLHGRFIHSQKSWEKEQGLKISQSLDNGIYLLQYKLKNRFETKKIIINN